MRYKLSGLLFFSALSLVLNSQSDRFYQNSYDTLESMLLGEIPMSFKEAVFQTENAFLEGMLNQEYFLRKIKGLRQLTRQMILANELDYQSKDKEIVEKYAALFNVMSNKIPVIFGNDTMHHMPFVYDFEDIFGTRDWSQTLVLKLLETGKGNCHSLPYLYKILADEIGAKAYLALAPNHIYIKHRCEKAGWYNTELTSGTFPIDAWLMASGYISLESVQKGIYLDTLTEKENIALCVIDLAQGYNHKYPDNEGTFVIKCCDLALKHFPDYVNAILLKAETRLKQLQAMQKEMKYAYLKEVTAIPEGKAKWDEMNSLYMQLYKLGYRQMPEQMYIEWLTSLKTEKEKYSNKNAPGATKD
jgi:hypothetical protein